MSSSPRVPGTVPITHAALPLWMATLSRWNRNWDDRGSPVVTEIRCPRFCKKSVAQSPRAPSVSTAMGLKL